MLLEEVENSRKSGHYHQHNRSLNVIKQSQAQLLILQARPEIIVFRLAKVKQIAGFVADSVPALVGREPKW